MYFLLIAVTGLAYARQQCTLAAEFGFKPVQASPTTWISHIRPVGWDTQGPCPRTDATVPFTTVEGVSPDVAETALPVFLYRRTQEITQGQTSTIETWTLIGSTPRNAQPSACSTRARILRVRAREPLRLLVQPLDPVTALGCPTPGRPTELIFDAPTGTDLKQGLVLQIKKNAGTRRWTGVLDTEEAQ